MRRKHREIDAVVGQGRAHRPRPTGPGRNCAAGHGSNPS
jgi:hypothetical protein